jgi:hypothetical protein
MGTDTIDSEASLSKLLDIYQTQGWQRLTRQTIAKLTAEGKDASLLIATNDAEDQISTLDALRAGDRIAKLLNGWRWNLMRQAREEGRSWSEIGAALDMTKQGAFDYYRNAVDRQEQYAPEYSDIAAARKVQGDPDD